MLVYCVTIWNTLWPFGIIYGRFGIVCGRWLYFSRFGMFGPRKIWQPGMWSLITGTFMGRHWRHFMSTLPTRTKSQKVLKSLWNRVSTKILINRETGCNKNITKSRNRVFGLKMDLSAAMANSFRQSASRARSRDSRATSSASQCQRHAQGHVTRVQHRRRHSVSKSRRSRL
jgi:hypothetical protein